jgi:single-strand DNA-binding protein
MGNLTATPQSKDVGENTVCTFSVAINSISKKEEVFFVDVECWNKVAQNCQKYLDKGSRALIEGKMKVNSWTSKEGQKREKFICVADLVTFISSPNQKSTATSADQGKQKEQQKEQDKELEEFEF